MRVAPAAPSFSRPMSAPAAESSADAEAKKPAPSKARPMPTQTEMRRQMVAYKEQVHELRIQYGKELAVKATQLLEAKEAKARLFATDVKALAKERAERSAFKKVRAHERMIEIQKIKKERMQAGLVSLKVFADKREEKYLSKFSTIALEAKTWCASEDAVEALIQDVLIDVKRPMYSMPQRPGATRRSY